MRAYKILVETLSSRLILRERSNCRVWLQFAYGRTEKNLAKAGSIVYTMKL